jgi:hypothetical protein
LALFMTQVLADNPDDAATPHHAATAADTLDAGSDFHEALSDPVLNAC